MNRASWAHDRAVKKLPQGIDLSLRQRHGFQETVFP